MKAIVCVDKNWGIGNADSLLFPILCHDKKICAVGQVTDIYSAVAISSLFTYESLFVV